VATLAAVTLTSLPAAAETNPRIWPFYDVDPGFAPQAIDESARRAPRRPRVAPQRAAKAKIATTRPKGPLVIAVSLQRQSLKVYDANGLFAEAPVSTGKRGHATPAGVFSIIQKNKWHRSNIYSGAPMPYMQRITWSGIALHAGALPGYPASHGCIRMPNAFATRLWDWTRRGARVVVSHGEVAPVAVAHPLLDALPVAVPLAVAPETPAPDSLGLRPTLSARPPRPGGLRVADATAVMQQNPPATASDAAASPAVPPQDVPTVAASPKRHGPLSVFISRADGRLYARQDFAPLFDVPVTIADADRSIGTHVFTARRDPADKDRFLWTVITLPDKAPVTSHSAKGGSHAHPTASGAAAALDRLSLPQDIMARIAEGLASGSSLIVADQSLKAGETGQGTEFVLLTR
jgi:lipoprotein-anchoring transpeptidase ErfK/SrfK